jgi:hypothetical protein
MPQPEQICNIRETGAQHLSEWFLEDIVRPLAGQTNENKVVNSASTNGRFLGNFVLKPSALYGAQLI